MNNRAHQNDMENFIPYTCIPILIRIIVPFLFPNFVQSVSYRPEVSTPISSYKRLKEGLFLFHIGLDPYDGGTFHQPPLLLLIYALIPEVLHVFLPTLLDISVAYCLFHIAKYRKSFLESEIWEKGELTIIEEEFEFEDSEETKELNEGLRKRKSSQHKKKEILSSLQDNFTDNNFTDKTIPPKDTLNPSLVALLYLSNPLSIFSCFGGSTSIWGSAGLVAAVHFACLGSKKYSMLFLAAAVYTSVYPIVALVPCSYILTIGKKVSAGEKSKEEINGELESKIKRSFRADILENFLIFLSFLLIFLLFSYFLLDNSLNFIKSFYGVILLVPDLTPNIGLFWYFFIEMFDQFRLFFLCVFQMLACGVFVGPISLKFQYQPLFAIYVLIALTTILKTYPSIGDMGISFGFVTLFPELFRYANGIYVSSLLLISCSCLLPAFHHLWLYSGSGNSNFYYAITLVCSVGQIGWVNDITTAMIKREGCRIGGRGIWRRYSVETSIE
ncbi:hypothetical protein HDU92_003231 [Lobulomyces angularis]|nr:hypothetical protein HDU92_003231 [Lobulomyces angularis]